MQNTSIVHITAADISEKRDDVTVGSHWRREKWQASSGCQWGDRSNGAEMPCCIVHSSHNLWLAPPSSDPFPNFDKACHFSEYEKESNKWSRDECHIVDSAKIWYVISIISRVVSTPLVRSVSPSWQGLSFFRVWRGIWEVEQRDNLSYCRFCKDLLLCLHNIHVLSLPDSSDLSPHHDKACHFSLLTVKPGTFHTSTWDLLYWSIQAMITHLHFLWSYKQRKQTCSQILISFE